MYNIIKKKSPLEISPQMLKLADKDFKITDMCPKESTRSSHCGIVG